MTGLLSDLKRKTGEGIAYLHDQQRQGIQKCIGHVPWDHQPLFATLADQVGEQLGEPDAVLVFDPSGFPKKGVKSVGVARQWCGRLGKVDHCQVGVSMADVSRKEHAIVDTRLYLPAEWAKDRGRREEAGVPETIEFRTRHELALEMLKECGGRLPHTWVAGDDEMGRPSGFRQELRTNNERYLLAVPSNLLIRDIEVTPPESSGRGPHPKVPFARLDRWCRALPEGVRPKLDVDFLVRFRHLDSVPRHLLSGVKPCPPSIVESSPTRHHDPDHRPVRHLDARLRDPTPAAAQRGRQPRHRRTTATLRHRRFPHPRRSRRHSTARDNSPRTIRPPTAPSRSNGTSLSPPTGARRSARSTGDARIVVTSTPLFAKIVSSKYAEFGSARVRRDLRDNHGRAVSRCLIQDLADAVAAVALAKEESWTYRLPSWDVPPATVSVGLDGSCMHLSEDGWRETMVGTLGFYDADGERLHTIYLGATPEYGKATFLERLTREVERAKAKLPEARYVGIADGAKGNWEFLERHTDGPGGGLLARGGVPRRGGGGGVPGPGPGAEDRGWTRCATS